MAQTFTEWQHSLPEDEKNAALTLGAEEGARARAAGVMNAEGDYVFTSPEQQGTYLQGQNPAFAALWQRYQQSNS